MEGAEAEPNAGRDQVITETSLHNPDSNSPPCCCICGDVGFQDQLFKCKKCLTRLQHLYCSNSYQSGGWRRDVCEWCIHARGRRCGLKKRTADAQQQNRSYDSNASRSKFSAEVAEGEHEKADCKGHLQQLQTLSSSASSGKSNKGKVVLVSSKNSNRRYKLLKDVLS